MVVGELRYSQLLDSKPGMTLNDEEKSAFDSESLSTQIRTSPPNFIVIYCEALLEDLEPSAVVPNWFKARDLDAH